MILAIRKSDEAVFEMVGCDGLYPVSILQDLVGNQFYEKDSNIKIVFEDRQPELFKECLSKRI